MKWIKCFGPPHFLTPETILPADRMTTEKHHKISPVAEFIAIKILDTLNNEFWFKREKNNVAQNLKEREDTVKQDLHNKVGKHNVNLQKPQVQKQPVQEFLNELDEQNAQLESSSKTSERKAVRWAQVISSLKAKKSTKDSQIPTEEEELTSVGEELSHLQQRTADLEQSVEQERLSWNLFSSTCKSQQEISSVQNTDEMKYLETIVINQIDATAHTVFL